LLQAGRHELDKSAGIQAWIVPALVRDKFSNRLIIKCFI
jgi:hypothetical protein